MIVKLTKEIIKKSKTSFWRLNGILSVKYEGLYYQCWVNGFGNVSQIHDRPHSPRFVKYAAIMKVSKKIAHQNNIDDCYQDIINKMGVGLERAPYEG